MTTANNHQRRGNCAPAISYLCLHSQLCDDTKLNVVFCIHYIDCRGKEDENENEEIIIYSFFFVSCLFSFCLREEEIDFIEEKS